MRLSRSSSLTLRFTRAGVNSEVRSWPKVVGSAVLAGVCDIGRSIDVWGGWEDSGGGPSAAKSFVRL